MSVKNVYPLWRTTAAQDDLDLDDRLTGLFRAHENTWIEAIVPYLGEPEQAGQVKTRILRKSVERLKAKPDRVLFPPGKRQLRPFIKGSMPVAASRLVVSLRAKV